MEEQKTKVNEQLVTTSQGIVPCTSGEGDALPDAKPPIFRNLIFWMVGRTNLPEQQLKGHIIAYGGVHRQGGHSRVSHFIADNLGVGSQTWRELRTRGDKGCHIVTSAWVLDSIKEGRRLAETRYAPQCLATGPTMKTLFGGGGSGAQTKSVSGIGSRMDGSAAKAEPEANSNSSAIAGLPAHENSCSETPSAVALVCEAAEPPGLDQHAAEVPSLKQHSGVSPISALVSADRTTSPEEELSVAAGSGSSDALTTSARKRKQDPEDIGRYQGKSACSSVHMEAMLSSDSAACAPPPEKRSRENSDDAQNRAVIFPPLAVEASKPCPKGLANAQELHRLLQDLVGALSSRLQLKGCLSHAVGLRVGMESLQEWSGAARARVAFDTGMSSGASRTAALVTPLESLASRATAALSLDSSTSVSAGWTALRRVAVRLHFERL